MLVLSWSWPWELGWGGRHASPSWAHGLCDHASPSSAVAAPPELGHLLGVELEGAGAAEDSGGVVEGGLVAAWREIERGCAVVAYLACPAWPVWLSVRLAGSEAEREAQHCHC